MRVLIACILGIGVTLPGWCQTAQQGISYGTMTITPEIVFDPGDGSFKRDDGLPGDAVQFQMSYSGAKNLKAYVVTVSFTDPETKEKVKAPIPAFGGIGITAPTYSGTNWELKFGKAPLTKSGASAECHASVDLLVYDDGSYFGPAKTVESHDVLAMLRGASMANPKVASMASPK
jgi:hypothetical protein